jgi:hypothetical protein
MGTAGELAVDHEQRVAIGDSRNAPILVRPAIERRERLLVTAGRDEKQVSSTIDARHAFERRRVGALSSPAYWKVRSLMRLAMCRLVSMRGSFLLLNSRERPSLVTYGSIASPS